MRVNSITLLALQAISVTFVGVIAADDLTDNQFWKAFVDNVDSFPTPPPTSPPTPPPTPPPSPGPTPPPSPGPTPPPSPGPTPPPTPGPSPPPSPPPTPNPTPPPTPGPTPPPTPLPTPEPTPPPTPGPTPGPTPPPTPGPTPPPTPGPTPPPTPSPTPIPTLPPTPPPSPPPTPPPTGECKIEGSINCTTIFNNAEISCDNITPEKEPVCSCPECVRELLFQYSGLACSPSSSSTGKCVDEGPNPFIAGYRITDCADTSVVIATGEVQQGEYVTITPGGTTLDCLPDSLCATISVPTGAVTQTFEIDSSCDGGTELTLQSNYGSFQSLGYSCSETDTHNCIQEVNYGLAVCNKGTEDEQVYEWTLTLDDGNGTPVEINLLSGKPPENLKLTPGECFYDIQPTIVDRCNSYKICADVMANATNPNTGLPPNCSWKDKLCTEWEKELTPPPSPPPTPPPSPFPSPAPSPAPTSSCVIEVNLTGCPEPETSLDNDCQGRPWVIQFRYNGGNCAQSNNLQPRQKFSCTDVGSGPPTGKGVSSYITAVQRGGSEVYFKGDVKVGEQFILNEDKVYDKLAADMTITISDVEGGNPLQVVNLHLSCSQPLFLFDKFGATQVISWQEVDGRIVSANYSDVQSGNIELELDASSDEVKPVRLLEMTVLTNVREEPIDYTPNVAGQVLEPGQKLELPGFSVDIDLSDRNRYTFFTTVIGETLDGTNTCNGFDFTECIVGFNLLPTFPTQVPTSSPTSTPYPTGDRSTTACEIDADIACRVVSLQGVTCDQLFAPNSLTCPATSDLLVAYLRYDGSFGDDAFLEIVCGEETAYIDRMIKSGETIEFNTRANACPEVNIILYDRDPNLGGSILASQTVSTSCPGPWTLGTKIAQAMVLDGYIDTTDGGATFDANVLEADIELSFSADNVGQFPLSVTSGTITDTNGVKTQVAGLPVPVPPRSSATLQTVKQKVNLSGREGEVVNIGLSVTGLTSNEFQLTCTDDETITYTL